MLLNIVSLLLLSFVARSSCVTFTDKAATFTHHTSFKSVSSNLLQRLKLPISVFEPGPCYKNHAGMGLEGQQAVELGIGSVETCAQYAWEYAKPNQANFVSFHKENHSCLWFETCPCFSDGGCSTHSNEKWVSASIGDIINTGSVSEPVRYDPTNANQGPDMRGVTDIVLRNYPRELPDTIIRHSTNDKSASSIHSSLTPLGTSKRQIGMPAIDAKSSSGRLFASANIDAEVVHGVDCSSGNHLEFLLKFKETCSMADLLRFARIVGAIMVCTIILICLIVLYLTKGFRDKERARKNALRKHAEVIIERKKQLTEKRLKREQSQQLASSATKKVLSDSESISETEVIENVA